MRTRTLAAPLVALVTLPLLGGTATAVPLADATLASTDARHYTDRTGDASSTVDITRVTASVTGPADGRLRITVRFAEPQSAGDHTAIYVDTDRPDAGPELRLAGARDSEYWFESVDTWNDRGRRAACDFFRMRQGRASMGVVVDRDCIGTGRVWFEVRTTGIEDGSTDWLGRARSFSAFTPAA
jgi:hypothetical protein